MIGAVFRAQLLNLWHDKGALAMTFLLPGIFFLIFAEIFTGAAGTELNLTVALANEMNDDLSQRLVGALRENPSLEPVGGAELTADEVRALVKGGEADIGLVLRKNGSLSETGGFGPAPIAIISDPSRGMTVPMLKGQVQRAWFDALPEVALGSVANLMEDQFIEFSDRQRAQLQEGLAEIRENALNGGGSGWTMETLTDREDVAGKSAALNHVAYYAGAVAFMFLLFAAAQSANSLLVEEETGILDRILAGPGGIAVLINGKFAYLVGLGLVQIGVIFLVAWLVYGVDLPGHLLGWLAVTLPACLAAAGIAMAIASGCRTRLQAQNLANVLILIMSAVGGSMVPRFFMPGWLRDLGWLTPNTWALEAYSSVFWRDEALLDILLPCGLMLSVGLAGLGAAHLLARRKAGL